MTQHFEDFKKEHPRIAEAMGILGMTHEEYCEACDRTVLRKIMEPPRISMSDSTVPFPGRPWYLRSATATKEN
jgi:hypothetical protein